MFKRKKVIPILPPTATVINPIQQVPFDEWVSHVKFGSQYTRHIADDDMTPEKLKANIIRDAQKLTTLKKEDK